MHIKYIDRKTGREKTESPPGEGFLKFLYHTAFGQLTLDVLVKRKLVSALYGRLMNRPNSRKKIRPFVEQYDIDLSESVKSIEEFTSFNDFFYRALKPEARPIQEGIVSPGDGKVIAFEDIGSIKDFFVKGSQFTLARYLQDEVLTRQFEDSSLVIVRLAPNDYHRFHFPYSGVASPSRQIRGRYLSVSPYALSVDFAKVFCENKRAFTILTTADKGTILISPVGATMVGSIRQTYQPNSEVQKGTEMGYFAFGGSSVLMLIDKKKVKIDPDILENTRNKMETFVKMGERIGT